MIEINYNSKIPIFVLLGIFLIAVTSITDVYAIPDPPGVELSGVDIFCDNETILAFTGLFPFLEICPIQEIPTLDTDGDGIPDENDLCSATPVGTPVDADGCPDTAPTDCIFCLPQEIKDIFFDISDVSGFISDFIFPDEPFDELNNIVIQGMFCLERPSQFNIDCWDSAFGLTLTDIGLRYETTSIITDFIGKDPPDNNFETVYPIPTFEILESDEITSSNILLVDFVNSLSEYNALLQAFLVTLERYQGALIADESEFVILQLTALQEYTDLIVENQIKLSNAASEYHLLTQDIISEGGLELLQQRLDDEGFSQTEFGILIDLDYTQSEILEIQDIIINFDISQIDEFSDTFNDFSVSLTPLTEELVPYSNQIEEFLDKSNLQSQKLSVIDTLESLKTGDKKVDKEIDNVIKHIAKSTDDKFWSDDGTTLDDKKSKKVFDEEKKAVKGLMKIVNKGDSGIDTEISDIIVILVDVNRELAQDAIDSVPTDTGDKKVDKEIEKAEKELGKGDKEASKGKFDKAIDKYKKAWEYAQKVLKKKK